MLWDLFCRVVDNFGDIGVCWRLSCDLASRGEEVRLWVDDPSALAWMASVVHPGVKVLRWTDEAAGIEAGDVVIEAFGCDPPPAFVERMARAATPPTWINLEYLSAEAYVERSHGLPSPHSSGLTKWFFYPGFTPATGGLIREADLLRQQQRFDAAAWLDRHQVHARPGERIVSLFCYDNPILPALLDTLSDQPTLLLAAAGPASTQVARELGTTLARRSLRAVLLPWLTQVEYDHLLWASELNFVRGEDSFVRAQWAAQPFVWQIYPQHDAAHAAKLQAFADRFLAMSDAAQAASVRALWAHWNGLADGAPTLPPLAPWRAACVVWRDSLLAQDDLATQLQRFVAERR
jgi:uncharacterized repeat protein (TIGR03837 family)